MPKLLKVDLQAFGCFVVAGLLVFLFMETVRSFWPLWLAAFALLGVWGALQGRRSRKLDVEYGFSIVGGHDDCRILAFHHGAQAFSIPFHLDEDPPRVDFTAALPEIPDADAAAWRERLTEYMKRKGGRCRIV